VVLSPEDEDGIPGISSVDWLAGFLRGFTTRVYRILTFSSTGVVGQELRGKQWSKILSLAPVHV
jgi:hypothetical protein